MTQFLTFFLAVVVLLATPGPTNTLLLTAGATGGLKSLRLLPAEISGYLIAILAIGYLIAPLILSSHLIAGILRLSVAAYLIFLAVRLWQHPTTAIDRQRLIRFRDVFVTTLLNPKALLFAMGIIPLQDAAAPVYLAAFSGLVGVIGGAWVILGAAIARGVMSPAQIGALPRFGAIAIAGFASYLVVLVFT